MVKVIDNVKHGHIVESNYLACHEQGQKIKRNKNLNAR